MLKDIKELVNREELLDGVWLNEDEPTYGRGSDIVEVAKHCIVDFVAFEYNNWEDKWNDIEMMSCLIMDIEDNGLLNSYVKVSYNPMGAWEVETLEGSN